jgi:transposase
MSAPKLDDSIHRTLVEAVRQGLYRESAAKLVGVSRRTFQRWLETGASESDLDLPEDQCKHEGRYRRLFEAVEQAEAQFEAEMVEMVADAARSKAPNTWQAAMTILERKMPDRYGKRDTTVLEAGEKPLVAINVLRDPETRELATGLLERLAGAQPTADLELQPAEETDEPA